MEKKRFFLQKKKYPRHIKNTVNARQNLNSMNMDEEQRNRELAFLEFEIKEIEKANLKPGEDEELEATVQKNEQC